MDHTIAWPTKSREFQNHHFDSTVWNKFRFRDSDIIIGTYAKSGTTWVQQIVAQLIFQGDPNVEPARLSPWLDLRYPSSGLKLLGMEMQKHRRFVKTHLPIDALVFSPKAKYIYIGRDGRDVVWSLYNHHINANQGWYDALNNTPGLVGPPMEPPTGDIRQYWREWMDRDGHPWWPFWEHIRGWWDARHVPNVRLIHFADLKRDMAGEIRRLAEYLAIPIDPSKWNAILEHCSFEWMKQHADKHRGAGEWFAGGAGTLFNKGVNGRWIDTLDAADIAEYETRAVQELGADCARWLATGERRDLTASATQDETSNAAV
jgi:aryl sulfotransferase